MLELSLWVSLTLIVYTYVGYGWIIGVAALSRPWPVAKRAITPRVSVLIVAHNEERLIRKKIYNLLSTRYPRQCLEVVVASDGSTDRTVAQATVASQDVRVVAFPHRRGKTSVLNELIPSLSSDIVVLADVRQEFHPAAISELVTSFADPSVGAVSGALKMVRTGETDAATEGVAWYWNFEKIIRKSESDLDSTIGATGAIYAIRRRLFAAIPPDTILDDVLIPLLITRQGFRVLFEPAAVALDYSENDGKVELARKIRTIAGNFQLFWRNRWLLNPLRNRLWFQAMSHKALRLGLPLLYSMVFFLNLALVERPFYRNVMLAQLIFYSMSLAGFLVPKTTRLTRLFVVPSAILLLAWATVVGLFRFVTGQQSVTWDRVTHRGPIAVGADVDRAS